MAMAADGAASDVSLPGADGVSIVDLEADPDAEEQEVRPAESASAEAAGPAAEGPEVQSMVPAGVGAAEQQLAVERQKVPRQEELPPASGRWRQYQAEAQATWLEWRAHSERIPTPTTWTRNLG